MSGFYVLDVPEFAPMVEAVKRSDRCKVHPVLRGYRYIEFNGEFEITREATGLGAAVWFGCLTAGLDGKIVSFTEKAIKLAPTNEPVLPLTKS
jgi:hypothetical protein